MSTIKYTVKKGDNLDNIAQQYGTTAKDIGNANAIKNLNLIYPGQELIIPRSASAYSSSSASGGNTKAPTTPTAPSQPVFDKSTYKPSDAVNTANTNLNTLLAQKPGAYTSTWMDQLKGTVEKILKRDEEGFNYDLNGDALYQQYKDKYIQQGKLAMHDAIGQASAMTGGYGNSYAQSVGQQQYQASLDNLNDIVPELYQMAYDRYNQEGQDLYNQFAMFGEMENLDYGRHRDTVTDWLAEREYLQGLANTAYDRDYTQWKDSVDAANNIAQREYENQYGAYSDALEMAYQKDRDKVADEQWQKQYDAVYGKKTEQTSGGVNDTSTPPDDKVVSGGAGHDNAGLTNAQIKALQNALGVTADGKYGEASKKAAGGLSADKAYQKYVVGKQTPTGGFTGSTYSEAVAYAKKNGVPSGAASGIMDQATWNRKKNSGSNTAEVKNYKTYKEYLADIVEYLTQQY